MRFGLTAIKNVGEGAIESLLGVRAKQGRITSLARAVRGSRSAARQQARVREPDQGGRVRFARRRHRRTTALPTLALRPRLICGASTRRASTARARSAIASRGRAGCSGWVDDDRRAERRSGGREAPLPEVDAVDRNRAARLREGDARPVLERPSGRSLRRRAEGVRRQDRRRPRRGAAGAGRAATPGGRAAASRWKPTPRSAASSPPAVS